MTDRFQNNRLQLLGLGALLMWGTLAASGCAYHCISCAKDAIPAARLDRCLFGSPKEAKVPILFSALGQERPDAYRVGPGDTLAVFVYGVLPPSVDETPVLSQYQTLNQRYYPPHGSIVHPSTGLPMTIGDDGTLELPLLGRIPMEGLTLQEVSDKIRKLYLDAAVIAAGRERISVSIITQRCHRIMVLRQDSPSPAVTITNPQTVDQVHRGSGEVIDLPAYENDVLHAMAATGGLPGTDGVREIWVLRNCAIAGTAGITESKIEEMVDRYEHGAECGPSVIRIPLYVYPGESLPFSPKDVILNAGDVVYIPRRLEYFYTGGLLNGAKIPLPADEDLDILEAIALATNSSGGPLGTSGAALANGTPGFVVHPSRVIIVRKLCDGSQISIRVDLDRAVDDEKERVLIQPDDLVMLYFKPTEGISNTALNFFNWNFQAPIVF
ncbi:polysaccharide biosynthesis/export family protein [Planctomicrobium piriforme]|uniref:Polysaccharide biosynthesis/export protein n=1 Tax=Planctomicrobium piriforme TaxID=1576369 RepID=A0A1I3DDS3_9PLAN|nr:polysaccharide biosynthesis/export family protein [Planctomicrobium piriforme]SFH84621.1 Polysaccharide biosynthesis/export protein [Planctomicrobium piriforme]